MVVRKKAGAEVEFGNTLFLAENPQGLILGSGEFQESAPADAALVPRTVARLQDAYAPGPKALGGDRGFDSELNRFGLNEEEIFNAICPRSPGQASAAEPLVEIQAHAEAAGANRRAHWHREECLPGWADAVKAFSTGS